MPSNTLDSFDEQERQIETQLRDLETRLLDQYGNSNGGPDRVRSVLTALRGRFAEARIRTFVPILIERAGHVELDEAR